ncbi:CHAT domain-containing protein [Pantanalinema rosaneae CENA516]|uniref:CHAT domain-containing protein n=1 Tax=Pantanalinema rosaneae TaxID=1620701 RepID=UPI003D6E0BB2
MTSLVFKLFQGLGGSAFAIVLLFSGFGVSPAIASAPKQSPTSPSPSLSTLLLNPQQIQQALDQNNIVGAIQQVELGWKTQFEEYYQGKLTAQLVEVADMSRALERLHRVTGQKTALVYAIPTPNHLELVVVFPGIRPIHQRVTAANREALGQLTRSFRLGIVDPNSPAQNYLKPSQQLYEWMIAPIAAELRAQGIDTLLFCLGGRLRGLPLAALHDGKQFLVEHYNLAIIPAFNLLDSRPSQLQNAKVLAMGASEFSHLPPLPAVPIELATITEQLWQGKALLNQDFTPENLKAEREAQAFSIVHLATHAEFSPGAIQNSYIQFWNSRVSPDQFRDLELRVPEVQLLVLSACRTALDPQAELGFAGSAVMSGSKATLASLWAVSDVGTLVLMSEFYRQLRSAPIKAAALRQAQIAMLNQQVTLTNNPAMQTRGTPLASTLARQRNTDLSHPYYWAGFTLVGNPW